MTYDIRAQLRRQIELEDEQRALGASRYQARALPWKDDPFALTLALGGFVGQAWKAYQDHGAAGYEHDEALATALQIGFLAAREGILEKTYVTGVRDLMKAAFSEQEDGLRAGYPRVGPARAFAALTLEGELESFSLRLKRILSF